MTIGRRIVARRRISWCLLAAAALTTAGGCTVDVLLAVVHGYGGGVDGGESVKCNTVANTNAMDSGTETDICAVDGGNSTLQELKCTWSMQLGDLNSTSWYPTTAIDGDGNLILAGAFGGLLKLGNTGLNTVTGSHFLTKFGAAGVPNWSRKLSGTNMVKSLRVVSESGAIIVFASVEGIIDWGLGQLKPLWPDAKSQNTITDTVVALFSPDGALLWNLRIDAYYADRAFAVDPSGNVFIVGFSKDGPDVHCDAGENVSVMKIAAQNGQELWRRCHNITGSFEFPRLAANSTGHSVVAAHVTGAISINGTPITGEGNGEQRFLAAFDSGGSVEWARGMGCMGGLHIEDVRVDAFGNITVGGRLHVANGVVAVMSGLNESGETVWTHTSKPSSDPRLLQTWLSDGSSDTTTFLDIRASDAVVDGSKNLLAEMATIDAMGSSCKMYQWSLGRVPCDDLLDPKCKYGSSSGSVGYFDFSFRDDRAFLANTVSGTFDLGCGPMISAGDTNIFIAKFAP